MATLKELRAEAGISREEFSRLTQRTLASIEKHEQGKYGMSLQAALDYSLTLGRLLSRTPSNLLMEIAEAERQHESQVLQ